jgi:hypothetical protein
MTAYLFSFIHGFENGDVEALQGGKDVNIPPEVLSKVI